MSSYEYTSGYIQRTKDGAYQGTLSIDGIELSGGIEAVCFEHEGVKYLWLKRKQILEYDFESQTYKQRKQKPYWEAYIKKQIDGNTVAYKGEFFFLKFKYSIVGVWDNVLGKEKQRLNLFVERLPMSQQSILLDINARKRKYE